MEIFDLMAQNYDTEKRITRANLIADKIRSYITDGRQKSALEYGCGTGLVGLQLADNFSSMLLVDSSPAMIEQVERKLSALDKPAISVQRRDFLAAAAPPDWQVDYVFSSLVLHHIEDTQTVLARLYDTLRGGGHLVIVDLDNDTEALKNKYPDFQGYHGFDQAELGEQLKKIGFTKVTSETFHYDTKIINGKEEPYAIFILDAQK